jgi:hypothetical protein
VEFGLVGKYDGIDVSASPQGVLLDRPGRSAVYHKDKPVDATGR